MRQPSGERNKSRDPALMTRRDSGWVGQARKDDVLNPIFTLPVPVLVINLERDADRMVDCRDAFALAHNFALRRSPGVIPAIPPTAQSFLTRGRKVQAGT